MVKSIIPRCPPFVEDSHIKQEDCAFVHVDSEAQKQEKTT